MRITPLFFSVLGASLMSAGVVTAHAANGAYYDPSNKASASGNTTAYELFRTIGCPGRQLLDTPCAVPKPADSDGDGVIDSKDKCPNTPAGRKVNADGCELDGDGDGVVDAKDKCPTTPAGRKVNADGCELDGDGDGIVDGLDACPAVFAKTADGCPLPVAPEPAPAPAPKKLILEGVNFDNDQATLRQDSFTVLDQAAASLKEWGDVKVEVAGHTDSRSGDDYNLKLSQRRADAVRSYLISKGVAADRLSAKGYGESKPVADNETEVGRFKNRRVELVPLK